MKPVRLSFTQEAGGLRIWLFGHIGWSRSRFTLGAALLAGGLVGLCAIGWASWETQQQIRFTQDATRALRTQQGNAARMAAHEGGRHVLSDEQRRTWNRVARQLNTPWSAILDALEISLPDGVALVSIEPDTSQGSVRLQVEAKTLDTLLAYAASLKTAEPFDKVSLIKHETNEQDPTRPLRLSLEAILKRRHGLLPGSHGVEQ